MAECDFHKPLGPSPQVQPSIAPVCRETWEPGGDGIPDRGSHRCVLLIHRGPHRCFCGIEWGAHIDGDDAQIGAEILRRVANHPYEQSMDGCMKCGLTKERHP